ncbi:hypothetical protein K505DRAFT_363948 [Melanomma pulvis-pyrius CBS 109.77]|uniref:Uncharacterized protein n=1 Tax=Melanomma pulvis-pyrius CBS 109.77 TaxID=1314802 RepID=A0A6A6X4Z9_9PLEO|nr:hypothetical protein K505DRAFT_363948 [Melanomma pulvis-pyrius CBS 109.77]
MGNIFSKVTQIACFTSKSFRHSHPEDADPTQTAGCPSASILQNDVESAVLFVPVRDSLDRLRTTAASMPPPHRNVKTKRHLQVVRDRLVPIGKYIVKKMRGKHNFVEVELKVCRYIAAHHWPLPMHTKTYLHIQSTYPNALYMDMLMNPKSFETPENPKNPEDYESYESHKSHGSYESHESHESHKSHESDNSLEDRENITAKDFPTSPLPVALSENNIAKSQKLGQDHTVPPSVSPDNQQLEQGDTKMVLTAEEHHPTTSTDLKPPIYLEDPRRNGSLGNSKLPSIQTRSEENIAQSQKSLESCTIAPTNSPVKQQLKMNDTEPAAIKEVQRPSVGSIEPVRIVACSNHFENLPLNSDNTPIVPTTQTRLPSSDSTLEMGEHNPQAKENAPQKLSKNARKRERRRAARDHHDEAEFKEDMFLAEQREERYLAELEIVKKALARAEQEKKQIIKQAEHDTQRLLKRVLEKDDLVKQTQVEADITKSVQSKATVEHQIRRQPVSRAYKHARSMIYWALDADVRKKVDGVWDGLELMKTRMHSPNSTEMLRTDGVAIAIHHRCITLFSKKYNPSLVLPSAFTDEDSEHQGLEYLMPEFLTLFRIHVGSRLTKILTRALLRPFVEAWICERRRDMSVEEALTELSSLGRLRENDILPGLLRMGLGRDDAVAELLRLGVLDKGKGQENGGGDDSKKVEVADFSIVGSKEEIVAQLGRLGMNEAEASAELSRLFLLKGIQGQGNGDRSSNHSGDADVDSDVEDRKYRIRGVQSKHIETDASRGTDKGIMRAKGE